MSTDGHHSVLLPDNEESPSIPAAPGGRGGARLRQYTAVTFAEAFLSTRATPATANAKAFLYVVSLLHGVLCAGHRMDTPLVAADGGKALVPGAYRSRHLLVAQYGTSVLPPVFDYGAMAVK